ncbi:MAG: SulP family inorganic anion transporter [Sphaerochaetaceae bacterium]|nr:SulP family inorganic anion transporter [Sphaerochaetaceae bacterium]
MVQQQNSLFSLKISKPRNLKNDFLSGLTVSLALVPEAIAFAFILGVDPIIGLYGAFMMGLITSIIGGRPGMISGATGAVAVILAPLVRERLAIGGMESALGYLFAQ